MDSVFRALWLAMNQWISCTIHWFTSSSSERETPNSRKLQNAFLVCCRNKQRNFTTNQASCLRNTRRKWRSSGWKFSQVKLCLFDLNLSIKRRKSFVVYKCKLSLSLALLFLVDLFINKLKTKSNNPFYRMILNTKRIHNSFWGNFPARAKQMPSKVLFAGKKERRQRPFGHCAPKL